MANPGEYLKWSFLFENTESAMLMRIEFLVVAIAAIFLLMSFLDMFRRQSRYSSIKYVLLVLDAISDSSFIYTIGLMQNAPFKKDLFSVWALILVNLRFNACFISAYGIPDQENTRLNESGKVVALLGVAFLIGTENSEFKHPIWVLWAMQQLRNIYLICAYSSATGSFLHGLSSPLVTAYMGTRDGICENGDPSTMLAYKYLVSGDHIQKVQLKPPEYTFHLEVTRRRKRRLITLDKIWLPIDQGLHVGNHENGDIGGGSSAQENAVIGGEGSTDENAGTGDSGSVEENAGIGGRGNAQENAGIAGGGSNQENVGIGGNDSAEENAGLCRGGTAQENASVNCEGSAEENGGINGRESVKNNDGIAGGGNAEEDDGIPAGGTVQENVGIGGRGSVQENVGIGAQENAGISGKDSAQEIAEIVGAKIPRENADISGNGSAQEDAGIGGRDSTQENSNTVGDDNTQGNGDIRTPWMKDMCLSFALYRLLRCRFDDLTLPADSIPHTRRLIYDIIGKKEDDKYLYLDEEIEKHSERAFRIVKLELAFLNDYFYTRYPILFWKGFPITVAWYPLLTIALIAWLARDIHKLYKPKEGETAHVIHGVNVDIIITWAFMGIIVLKESWKMVTYLLSDWTKVMLLCEYTSAHSLRLKSRWLVSITRWLGELLIKILCTPRCKIVHRWHNKIGQYDFLQSFGYNPWNILHYSSLGLLPKDIKGAKVRDPTKLPEAVKTAVVKSLCLQKFGKNSLELGLPADDSQFTWTFRLKTWSHSILVWHIATSLCEIELSQHYNASLTISEVLCAIKTALNCFSSQPYVIKEERIEGALRANYIAANSISRYCAYLLVKEPDLLPDSYLTADEILQHTLDDAADILNGCDTLQSIYRILIREGEPVDPQQAHQDDQNMEGWQAHPNMLLVKAAKLAWSLIHEFSDEKLRWKILAEVWADILVHTAPSWNSAAHKKCLATGGEFITHIWVMLSHCDVRSSKRWPSQTSPRDLLLPQVAERDDARVPSNDTLQEQGHPAVNIENKWTRPAAGFLKLNVSADFDEETDGGAFGVILRDSAGMFVAASSRYIPDVLDVPSMYAEALLEGLKLAETIGCMSITAESDLEELVNTIAHPSLLTQMEPGAAIIFDDCLAHLVGFSSATVDNCPWEANAAAHELVRYSFTKRLGEFWNGQPPDFLTNTLADDRGDENKWTSPAEGVLKLNVGASFNAEAGSGSFGVILRDSAGLLVAACSRFIPHVMDVPSMEAEALLEGLKLAEKIGCKYIIAESDSEGLVYTIANPSLLTRLAPGAAIIFNDCLAHLAGFSSAAVVNCPREANAAAHELVRYSFTKRLGEFWNDQPPDFLTNTLADDRGHPAANGENKWTRPPAGFVKLNVGAAFSVETGSGAFGVIVRDSAGMFKASCCRFEPRVRDFPSMQAEALREGLKLAQKIRCKYIIAESDSEEVVNAIANPLCYRPSSVVIIYNCRARMKKFRRATVSHCQREANAAAYELVRYSFTQRLSEIWKDEPPGFLIDTLANDRPEASDALVEQGHPAANDEIKWTRPASGFLKLNVGAAFSVKTRSGAFGVIIRDSAGKFKASYSRFIPDVKNFPSMQAEALIEGLKLAQTIRCKYIIAESDSEVVVNEIANPSSGAAIINDCREQIRKFRTATVVLCPREANVAAYELVRYSFTQRLSEIWKGQPPGFLIDTIADEVRSSERSPSQTSPQDAEETAAPEGLGGEDHAPEGLGGEDHAPDGLGGEDHAPEGLGGEDHAPEGLGDHRPFPHEAARDDSGVPSTDALQEQGQPAANDENKWTRPAEGFLKLNVSAGFDEETGSGAFGVILRDSAGMLVAAYSRFIPHLYVPSMEAEALLEGLKLAETNGCKFITAESDSKGLVDTITNPYFLNRMPPRAALNFSDCLAHLALFSSSTVLHCPREANAAAHELVCYSFITKRLRAIWKDQSPGFLIDTLANDRADDPAAGTSNTIPLQHSSANNKQFDSPPSDALVEQGHPAANDENKWTRPAEGFLKLNVGAAFSVKTRSGAFGVIVRDSAGKFKASYSRFTPQVLDFPSMQAEALLEGLKLARTIRCKYIIAETDSEEVVNAIRNVGSLCYMASAAAIINDCRAQIEKFRMAIVDHCPREVNEAAYELVRYSFTQRLGKIWKGQTPGFLIDTIAGEVCSSERSPSQTSAEDAEEIVAATEGLGGENHTPAQQEPPAGDDRLVPHEVARDDAKVPSTDALQEGHPAADDKNKWTRPAAGFLKLNVGAALNAEAGSGAFGVILRDSAGLLVAACSRFIPHVLNVPSMEAEALLEGLKLAEKIGYKSITAESDSEGLVHGIGNPSSLIRMAPGAAIIFNDCLAHLRGFSSATVVHCSREANAAAHELVHYSFTKRLGEFWNDQPPDFLINTLADDRGHPAAGISNPIPLEHSSANNQQFDRVADA